MFKRNYMKELTLVSNPLLKGHSGIFNFHQPSMDHSGFYIPSLNSYSPVLFPSPPLTPLSCTHCHPGPPPLATKSDCFHPGGQKLENGKACYILKIHSSIVYLYYIITYISNYHIISSKIVSICISYNIFKV